MTNPSTPPAPLEELLRKVIEAQVKGGYRWHKPLIAATLRMKDEYLHFCLGVGYEWQGHHVLALLLDTEGAKAAWGETYTFGFPTVQSHVEQNWEYATSRIHESWQSSPGNNVRAALETAVSFLPND